MPTHETGTREDWLAAGLELLGTRKASRISLTWGRPSDGYEIEFRNPDEISMPSSAGTPATRFASVPMEARSSSPARSSPGEGVRRLSEPEGRGHGGRADR